MNNIYDKVYEYPSNSEFLRFSNHFPHTCFLCRSQIFETVPPWWCIYKLSHFIYFHSNNKYTANESMFLFTIRLVVCYCCVVCCRYLYLWIYKWILLLNYVESYMDTIIKLFEMHSKIIHLHCMFSKQ